MSEQKPDQKEQESKKVSEEMQAMIEKSIEFENQIKAEVEEATPFISAKLPIDVFIQEYQDNKFYEAFVSLKSVFPFVRRLRRDGNCFYRAYLLQMFEFLYQNQKDPIFEETIKRIEESKEFLLISGYEELVTQDFIKITLKSLKKLREIKKEDCEEHLLKLFSNKEQCPYMIMFLRFIAAGYLKQNAILFEGFFEGEDMAQFCSREVEPLDVEADQLQIIALTSYFQHIGVQITTVASGAKCITNRIPEDGPKVEYCIKVLFTPGHYDALYKS